MNTVIMSSDQLDDGSFVVNFDELDDTDTVSVTGGYVHVRLENGFVTVTAFDRDGAVMGETVYPERSFL